MANDNKLQVKFLKKDMRFKLDLGSTRTYTVVSMRKATYFESLGIWTYSIFVKIPNNVIELRKAEDTVVFII